MLPFFVAPSQDVAEQGTAQLQQLQQLLQAMAPQPVLVLPPQQFLQAMAPQQQQRQLMQPTAQQLPLQLVLPRQQQAMAQQQPLQLVLPRQQQATVQRRRLTPQPPSQPPEPGFVAMQRLAMQLAPGASSEHEDVAEWEGEAEHEAEHEDLAEAEHEDLAEAEQEDLAEAEHEAEHQREKAPGRRRRRRRRVRVRALAAPSSAGDVGQHEDDFECEAEPEELPPAPPARRARRFYAPVPRVRAPVEDPGQEERAPAEERACARPRCMRPGQVHFGWYCCAQCRDAPPGRPSANHGWRCSGPAMGMGAQSPHAIDWSWVLTKGTKKKDKKVIGRA